MNTIVKSFVKSTALALALFAFSTQAHATLVISNVDPGPSARMIEFKFEQSTQNVILVEAGDVSNVTFEITKTIPLIDEARVISSAPAVTVGPSEVTVQDNAEFIFGPPVGLSDYFTLVSTVGSLDTARVFVDVDAVNPMIGNDLLEGNDILLAFADGVLRIDGDEGPMPGLILDGESLYVSLYVAGCVPTTEICDALDNDCDGVIDNGFDLGAACSVGVGECTNAGEQVCTADGSATECNATPNAPTTEICDALDNDCDGDIDEDFDLGAACSVGVGECTNAGEQVCTADGSATECNATPNAPTTESCDALDNDCDGDIDEDFDLGAACSVGVGECTNAGEQVCTADGSATECNATPNAPTTESCDALDNDCDGVIDNSCPQVDKAATIEQLKALLPTNKHGVDKTIQKAIDYIEKSLAIHVKKNGSVEDKHIVWLDAETLQCKGGHKVFVNEYKAVKRLMKIINPRHKHTHDDYDDNDGYDDKGECRSRGHKHRNGHHHLDDLSAIAVIENVISSLVGVDQTLASVAISISDPENKGVNIDKAEKEFDKGISEDKPNKQINFFKKAWKQATGKCENPKKPKKEYKHKKPKKDDKHKKGSKASCISQIVVSCVNGAGDNELITKNGDEIGHPETMFTTSDGRGIGNFHTSCSHCIRVQDSSGECSIVSLTNDDRLDEKCGD